MKKRHLANTGKTNPKQTQNKPKTNPKQTQNKPKQTQNKSKIPRGAKQIEDPEGTQFQTNRLSATRAILDKMQLLLYNVHTLKYNFWSWRTE